MSIFVEETILGHGSLETKMSHRLKIKINFYQNKSEFRCCEALASRQTVYRKEACGVERYSQEVCSRIEINGKIKKFI